MDAETRESLRRAQAYWHHPKTVDMFARYGLKAEVLSSYRRHRKARNPPEVALVMALFDWDL